MNHMSVSDHSDENLTITGWVQVVVKFVLMWSSVCCRYKLNKKLFCYIHNIACVKMNLEYNVACSLCSYN